MAKNQLRDPETGKFISKEKLESLTEEELNDVIKFNIEKYDYVPEEEIKPAKKKEPVITEAIFRANKPFLKLSMDKGKSIEFENGLYIATDKREIEFLMWKKDHPQPGSRVTVENITYEGDE